MYRTRTL